MKQNEEIKIEETKIEEMNYPVETEIYEEPEIEKEGVSGKALAFIGGAIGLAAFGLWKGRKAIKAKCTNRTINKLEKQGFTVIGPEDIIDEDDYDFDESIESKEVETAK